MFELSGQRRKRAPGMMAALLVHGAAVALLLWAGRPKPDSGKPPLIDVVVIGRPPSARPATGSGDHARPKPTKPPLKVRHLDAAKPRPVAPPAAPVDPEPESPAEDDEPTSAGTSDGMSFGMSPGTSSGTPGGTLSAASPEPTLGFTAPELSRRARALCDPPQMPEQARLLGITGSVVVRYTVGRDGRARDVQLLKDPAPVLSEAVARWLASCTFDPALAGDQPVAVRITQPFVFRIR